MKKKNWCKHVKWRENFCFNPVGPGRTGYWLVYSDKYAPISNQWLMDDVMLFCPLCGAKRP